MQNSNANNTLAWNVDVIFEVALFESGGRTERQLADERERLLYVFLSMRTSHCLIVNGIGSFHWRKSDFASGNQKTSTHPK